MNWISSRPGSGAPASVVSGSASAAASETAPRIPAQLADDPRRARSARRATCEGRRSMALIRKVTTKFHRKRTAMTAAQTAAA